MAAAGGNPLYFLCWNPTPQLQMSHTDAAATPTYNTTLRNIYSNPYFPGKSYIMGNKSIIQRIVSESIFLRRCHWHFFDFWAQPSVGEELIRPKFVHLATASSELSRASFTYMAHRRDIPWNSMAEQNVGSLEC